MKTRALVTGLIAAAGFAAAANAQVNTTASSSVTCTVEYMGDTNIYLGGAGSSNHNGVVEPGEGALLRINVSYTGRNTTGTWSGGTSGSGTIRGLGGGFIDLIGAGGTAGLWDVSSVYGAGTNSIGDPEDWTYGPAAQFQNSTHPDTPAVPFSTGTSVAWGVPGGNGAPAGNNYINVQFGQLPPSASAINAVGPNILGIFTMVWVPGVYTDRFVSFNPQASLAAGANPFSVLFKTATNVVSAFTTGNQFAGTGSIHVAPAPSSLALLGLGGLIAGRRRRR